MLLRITVQPDNQPAYTLEFFDHELARDMMRLIASGAVSMSSPEPASPAPYAPEPDPSSLHYSPISDDATAQPDDAPEDPLPIADAAVYQQAADYCRRINPLGDMRRVVVATYAAELHMGAEGVSATELSRIFDATGWPQPTDFVQAIRNAAREKFGWLERVGNPGYYKVTATGRAAVLGDTVSEQPPASPLAMEQAPANGVYETAAP